MVKPRSLIILLSLLSIWLKLFALNIILAFSIMQNFLVALLKNNSNISSSLLNVKVSPFNNVAFILLHFTTALLQLRLQY